MITGFKVFGIPKKIIRVTRSEFRTESFRGIFKEWLA